jgi:putative two-component system response regulator
VDRPRRRVLLIDDAPETALLLRPSMQALCDLHAAYSGADGLLHADSDPQPHLILLDVRMPGMDGFEVLRNLLANPRTASIPVIFLTCANEDDIELRALNAGAVDFVSKPLRPAVVLARVRTQLQLRSMRQQLLDENHYLEHEVERRVLEASLVRDVSIRALANLAEVRDHETGAHILRTQMYVRLLATALARQPRYQTVLSPRLIDLYAKAAALHDVGKIGIPDSILQKPCPLTPEEQLIMQRHAALGADAIWNAIRQEPDRDALDFMYVAMDIARHHHEHWDGTGYPDALAGDSIPLSARLMAVADVFDALIFARIYKPAYSEVQAISTIMNGAGKQFDPAVVEAFRECQQDLLRVAVEQRG